MGADGDIGLHPRGHVVAQDLRHPADRRGALGRLIGDLRDHDLALGGTAQAIARDDDVMGEPLVVRHHEADPALLVEAADDAAGVALQGLRHGPLQATAPIATADPDHHPIAMEQSLHVLGVEIEVIAAVVRPHEAEAVLVADHPPDDQVATVDDTEGVLAVTQELAVPHHGAQAALQGDQVILGGEVQGLGQLRELQRGAVGGQGLEDELATRDGVFVFLQLALAMRVLVASGAARRRGRGFGGGRFASCHVVLLTLHINLS